uniref:Sialidase domain-containing protein n=1 Tax=Alexandrium monilatum TaxID=311494 RepID=A0A7S4PSU9_9DINO
MPCLPCDNLLLWFPLPCRHAVDLLLQPALWPFFRFFLALLVRTRLLRRIGPRSAPPQPEVLEASGPPKCIFPPPAGEGPPVQDYGSYRIPALLQLGGALRDVVLALAEGRGASKLDWGRIDLVLRRSTDGGASWGPLTVVASGEAVGLPGATVGNPCACWDEQRQRVLLTFTVTEAGASEPAVWCRAAPPRRVFATVSDDGGVSWRTPRDIGAQASLSDWTWYATGPGRAVQLRCREHAGRIVVPCDHVRTSGCGGPVGVCCLDFKLRSHVIFSDDGGESWHIGGCGPEGTNECQLVELRDGSLLLNMRDFTGRCCRRVAVSRDGGASFDDLGHQEALPEPLPAGCQASVLAVPGGPLLFSCPADPGGQRCDLQVRGSWDEGQSWPTAVRIHGSLAAYSCLELLRAAGGGAAEVAVLFEAGSADSGAYESISLCRVPLSEFAARGQQAEAAAGESAPLMRAGQA